MQQHPLTWHSATGVERWIRSSTESGRVLEGGVWLRGEAGALEVRLGGSWRGVFGLEVRLVGGVFGLEVRLVGGMFGLEVRLGGS